MPVWIAALVLLVVADVAVQLLLMARLSRKQRTVTDLATRSSPEATSDPDYVGAEAELRSARRQFMLGMIGAGVLVGGAVLALSFASG